MEKYSLSWKAYEATKEKVVFGEIKSGEVITVGDLANEFNMSKTPVRDALNRLKSDGLLNLIPYKGYVVSHIDLKDLNDLFQLRILLESEAARLATLKADNQGIDKLEKLAGKEFQEEVFGENSFMKMNFNFHISVAQASGNKLFVKLLSNTLDQMQRVLFNDLKSSNKDAMIEEHLELVQVMKSGDALRARSIASKHIESSRSRILSNSLGNGVDNFGSFRSY